MALSKKQKGVITGMLSAMLISVVIILFAVLFDPLNYSNISQVSDRLNILAGSLILPTLFLIFCIARLAKFRFFSPEDIDGSGLTYGSGHARLLQSLLQNTLEQLVIAFGAYTIWCLLMPSAWLSAVPLCSLLFAIGRVFFFKGYHLGAPGRALGFALTFYSTVMLLVVLLGYQLMVAISY
ncbi:MAPEG family protein [Psychromonas sp. RZ22]|uniref:MAPEG family protein n=1 Tax=Psychromonas algarum TaxID=2555643 RepID=UPI0010687954|nr:MAPEG family protein [Psychromonas sp. RZ22]TEW54144.1 MAPEG family protein [Psychromonas sp. RZ22]